METFNLQIAADNQQLDFNKHGNNPDEQIEKSENFEIVTAEEIAKRLVEIIKENHTDYYTKRLKDLNNKTPVLVMDVGIHGRDNSKSKIGLFYCVNNEIHEADEIAHVDILNGTDIKQMNRLYLLDSKPSSLLFINTEARYNDKGICHKIGTVDENGIFFANISEQN